MTKQLFIAKLRKKLSYLPHKELADRLAFYGEMIDDCMEEGLSEEEAVKRIGSVDELAALQMSDEITEPVRGKKERPKKRLRAWEITLLAVGSPLWLSLLIAAFAVALSLFLAAFAVILALYASLWAILISLWAVFAALVGSAVGGVLFCVVMICLGNGAAGFSVLGAGLCCAGLSILTFFGCRLATKATCRMTQALATSVKKRFSGKEKNNG